MRRKSCVWRATIMLTPTDSGILDTYKLQYNCRQLIRNFEIKKEAKVMNAKDTGNFFRCVNSKPSASGVGALRNSAGVLVKPDDVRFYCALNVVLERYCYRKLSVRQSVRCRSVCNVDVP